MKPDTSDCNEEKNMFKGVTFGYYGKNGYYSSEKARGKIDKIAELGIPWVCLISTIMQDAFL